MRGIETLVDPEEIPQEGDVLGQKRAPECRGCLRVIWFAAVIPAPRLQQVDVVVPAELIQVTAADFLPQLIPFLF